MIKKTLIFVAFSCYALTKSFSQNEIDALRYSWIGTGGTARYQSLGGAMGAVGGDASCMAVNPAGLARYTKSDISLSFATTSFSTNTEYNGTTAYNGKGNFGLNNLTLIGAYKNPEENEWKSVQFGIGYQKLFNLNNAIYMKGVGDNSLLDQFAGDASGTPSGDLQANFPYTSYLAYEAYLIDPDMTSSANEYTTQMFTSKTNQERSLYKTGKYAETNISVSGNYMDKVYLGMSVGFPTIRYQEEMLHSETPVDTSLFLEKFDYTQSLTTRGNGINLKIGAIYTPVEWLRLGFALQTASSLGLTDEWSNTIHSDFKNDIAFDVNSENGLYNYRLKTPGRITASGAVIISKYGLVSVDYEMVNYARAKFKPDNYYGAGAYSFDGENLVIKTIYTQVSNLRFGTEWRYNWVSIRGGYSIYGNPFADGATTVDAKRTSISAGVGFRVKGFFADLGWVQTKWSEAYFMYDPILVNTAKINNTISQFVLTGGFRF